MSHSVLSVFPNATTEFRKTVSKEMTLSLNKQVAKDTSEVETKA